MQIIPIISAASQTFSVVLAEQSCKVDLYQKYSGFYCNLYLDNELVIGGVICENINRIVRDPYLGFVGDLIFIDTQGSDDPDYSTDGLGTRFLFAYLTETDLGGAVAVTNSAPPTPTPAVPPTGVGGIISVDNLIEARDLPIADLTDGLPLLRRGYYSSGDGGNALYYWSSSSTVADDGTNVMKPNAIISGPGRWLLLPT